MKSNVSRDAQKFKERTGSDWVDSSSVHYCAECHGKFTVLNRKHHCRQCGQVVCKSCSPETVLIGQDRVRVCASCFDDSSLHGAGSTASFETEKCIFCRGTARGTSGYVLKKDTAQNNISVTWHPSCMKCSACSKALELRDAYINPPLGSILHTLDDVHVQCFCQAHIGLVSLSPNESFRQPLQNPRLSVAVSRESSSGEGGEFDPSDISPQECVRVQYGPSPSQYFSLYIPVEVARDSSLHTPSNSVTSPTARSFSVPLVVVIHGGFWKSQYGVDNSCIESLVPRLVGAGMAVCMVEYRRVGASCQEDEGGYPDTNEDILLALRRVHEECLSLNEDSEGLERSESISSAAYRTRPRRLAVVDTERTVILGHSAGGYLALWTCCELEKRNLPMKPSLCVAIAPVCDFAEACRRKLSDDGDAVEKFMRMPYDLASPECLEAYGSACPSKALPLQVPTILAIGDADVDIPPDMVEDFYWYAKKVGGEAATRGVPMASSVDSGEDNMGRMKRGDTLDSIPETSPVQSQGVKRDRCRKVLQRKTSCVVPVPLKFLKIQGANHFDVVNSSTDAWARIFDEMFTLMPNLADVPPLESLLCRISDVDTTTTDIHDVSGAEQKSQQRIPKGMQDNNNQVITTVKGMQVNNQVIAMAEDTAEKERVVDRWADQNEITHPGYMEEHDDDDSSLSSSDDDDMPVKSSPLLKKQSRLSRSSRSGSSPPRATIDDNMKARVVGNGAPEVTTGDHENAAEFFSFPAPKSEAGKRNSFNFRFRRNDW